MIVYCHSPVWLRWRYQLPVPDMRGHARPAFPATATIRTPDSALYHGRYRDC
jgi:hypothetical protein